MTAKERKQIHKPKRKKETVDLEPLKGNANPVTYMKFIIGALSIGLASVSIFLKMGSNRGGEDGVATFSSALNLSQQLVYTVKCSDDYNSEAFHDCKPKRCGRVVMDRLVSEEEASYLLKLAKRGLSYGGSSGGASILDLHSGALSKNDKFINIYSIISEEDGFTEDDFALYRVYDAHEYVQTLYKGFMEMEILEIQVKNKIHRAIAEHFNIPLSKLYLTKPTFFSRMNMTEAKTVHDEYWHSHVDKITYGSFHYTSLLYLSTYKKDFTGGRFIFVDKDENRTVEPRLGRVSFFTSGSENVHFVEKLQSGVRYAITISFTCNPDMSISDPSTR